MTAKLWSGDGLLYLGRSAWQACSAAELEMTSFRKLHRRRCCDGASWATYNETACGEWWESNSNSKTSALGKMRARSAAGPLSRLVNRTRWTHEFSTALHTLLAALMLA
jgi:hypothetical protein